MGGSFHWEAWRKALHSSSDNIAAEKIRWQAARAHTEVEASNVSLNRTGDLGIQTDESQSRDCNEAGLKSCSNHLNHLTFYPFYQHNSCVRRLREKKIKQTQKQMKLMMMVNQLETSRQALDFE